MCMDSYPNQNYHMATFANGIQMRGFFRSFLCLMFVFLAMRPALAQEQPDILILGDSQISFGAGEEYLKYFKDLETHCADHGARPRLLAKLGDRDAAAIGVRSTSIHSWTTTRGGARGQLCDVDKQFGVNAGAYGIDGNNKRVFIQIGRGKSYQFCTPGKTGFQNAFAEGYYKPKLVVLAFLGNAPDRWIDDPELALKDARDTVAQIPDDIPCVFMTTAPVFLKKTNDKRMKAQRIIADAFAKEGR